MAEFREEEFSSEKFSFAVWKKIIKLVIEQPKYIVLALVSIFAVTLLDIAYPLLNAFAIDKFFTEKDYSLIWLFIVLYILIAVGYGVFVYLFIKNAGVVETSVGYKIRSEAFNKLQHLSFSYFDKTPAGWIMARLTSDSRRLATIISWGLVDMVWGLSLMGGILVTLFIINYKLALIMTAIIPLLFIASLYLRKKVLISYRNARKINSEITGAYNEGILGSKTTKTLVLEDTNFKEFDAKTLKMKKSSIRAIIYSSLFFPTLIAISYAGILFIMQSGGKMVLTGIITVPVLYLFISYTTHFFEPIMQLARILAELQQAQASAERIMSLIETEPDIKDSEEVIEKYGDLLNPKVENWEELIGDIEFRNVSFHYIEQEPVLSNFNLKVKAGTTVAIVGETGSGKSTIVNLLCRFYEPVSGEILIDGINYKERSLAWLHSNIGYVLQSPHLFNGTIFENIAYGKPDATLEEVIKVAKVVSAHDFIMALPNGYDTNVGEGGAKLSVGEKQLISFARAIISDPKILILDEATSSIDTKTEDTIQKVIKKVLAGRTSFMIAHRLSTVRDADLILVLDKGEIIEQGTHQELLAKRGEYFELYKTQFIAEQIEKSKF